ncbi:MAG: sulfite exporter TauE/SafE family protein [Planctomycetaceae bacterium]|nr:sulfite exporter TauE/SafE family protein [Planctomycetaceae bacterium]
MMELPLVFLGGLLGSSHCIGMCGGFAVMLGIERPSVGRNLVAQLTYSAGRIFTYSALGAIVGYGGQWLSQTASQWINVSAVLCVLAGLFLVSEGLAAAGFRLFGRPAASVTGCLMGKQFASLLKGPGLQTSFVAGVLTGFLPCGLVYAFLSLAATTEHVGWGAATMAAFGLGTVPLMVTAGVGMSFVQLATRRRLLQLAACCVVVTGLLTVARGAGFLQNSMGPEPASPACPFCLESSETDVAH